MKKIKIFNQNDKVNSFENDYRITCFITCFLCETTPNIMIIITRIFIQDNLSVLKKNCYQQGPVIIS